jgi:hypothetical protein
MRLIFGTGLIYYALRQQRPKQQQLLLNFLLTSRDDNKTKEHI